MGNTLSRIDILANEEKEVVTTKKVGKSEHEGHEGEEESRKSASKEQPNNKCKCFVTDGFMGNLRNNREMEKCFESSTLNREENILNCAIVINRPFP